MSMYRTRQSPPRPGSCVGPVLAVLFWLILFALAALLFAPARAAEPTVDATLAAGECATFVSDEGNTTTACLLDTDTPDCRVFVYRGPRDPWYVNYWGSLLLVAGEKRAEDILYPALRCAPDTEPMALQLWSETKEPVVWTYLPGVTR